MLGSCYNIRQTTTIPLRYREIMILITNLATSIYTQNDRDNLSEPDVVSVKAKDFGCGTGFFVRENLIVTNIHCVAGATSVSVKPFESNTEYDVEGIAAYDALNDLAILKVEGQGTPFPIYDSDIVDKGEAVKAIGCPNGKYVTTDGVFHSSLNRNEWLQTTAKTGDGYSGGPLLNSNGQVIGIHFGSGNYYSSAISSNILKELLLNTDTIIPFREWQEKKEISAYNYLVKRKIKIQSKEYEDAITDLDIAIQRNPQYIIAYIKRGDAVEALAESKYWKGNLVEAQKLHHNAINDFTEVIRLCPDFLAGFYGRGSATSRLGELKIKDDLTEAKQLLLEAINDLSQAIRLYTDYALAYNNRANAKLILGKIEEKMGNIQRSQGIFQDALTDINFAINVNIDTPLEKDQDVAVCFHTRGEIREAIGDLHGAITDFEKAIKNNEYTENSTVSDDLKRVKDALENTQ